MGELGLPQPPGKPDHTAVRSVLGLDVGFHEPWGWTPYHYGRWFLYGKSWMWWPGPVDGGGKLPPGVGSGYVSFFGFGGHRGVSVGFGSVGWLPLGPGDSFYPWYGRNGSQLKGGRVTDATNITDSLASSPHCATTTSSPM